MNSGISKKLIFTYFLLINFIQSSKSVDFQKINKSGNNSFTKLSLSNISNKKILLNPPFLSIKTNFGITSDNKKLFNQYSDQKLTQISEKQKEIVIQADKQSEINDIIFADGNVSVSYKGKLLKADNLTYDKLNKKISAKGNIELKLGDQIFKVSSLEYSFISEKGYLLDVQGSINTNSLINDLSSNFSLSDSKKIKSFLELKKKGSFQYT